MKGFHRAAEFAIYILAGLGIIFLTQRLLAQGVIIDASRPPKHFINLMYLLTDPQPFQWARMIMLENFSYNSAIMQLFIAASETIRYQGLYFFCLLLIKYFYVEVRISLTFQVFNLLLFSFIFASLHYEIILPFVAGIVFNTLVWKYHSLSFPLPLLPPFFLHFVWNIIPPPIPTFF